ncbi:MAG: hypothetical protein WBQ26_15930 [Gemmatimonadaceae bacterium]|nr:hypothetical protein [Gemmatimonadaceae bacterium]
MSDDILYQRFLASGPAVRIRRTSDAGVFPVTAVLEVDRRGGVPRENEAGAPPPLMHCEGATAAEVLALLEPAARDDRIIVQLMRDRQLR